MQDLNKSTHIPYRPDIDGLRAIAVIPVVIFHAFPESTLIGGFMGVDIFFVISGFLISLILLGDLNKKKFSFLNFYSRRILRIFPALITVLSFCLLVGWLSLFPDEYKQVAKHVASGTAFIVNLVLWNEVGYFDTSAALKPLLHLWSLGVEEQFYIIWPVLLLFIWKAKFGFFRTTLILGAISFFASIYMADTDQTQVFYSPLTRFWELMVGGNLAYLVIKYNKYIENVEGRHQKFQSLIRALLNIQSFIGSLLIALGLLLFGISFPGFLLRFLVVMLPVLGVFLLISSRPNAWINRKIISNKLLVLVIHNKYFKFIVGVLLVALGLFTFGTSKSADLLLKFLVVMLPAFGAFLLISAGPNAWVNRKTISNKFLASIGLARFWGQMVGGNLAFRAIQNIYNQCLAANQHNFLALIRTLFINLQSFIGALLIVLSLFLFGNSSKLPGFLVKAPVVMLPVFGAFLLIAAGPSAWINRKILSNKLFVSIGLISYPLYLWHWPLLAFPRIGISDGSYRDILPLNRFIAILVSVFFSWATYQFIEKPIRFGGKKQIWTLTLGLAMIGIGIFGSIVFMSNGIPDRIALTPPTASILFSDYPHPLKNEACKNQYPEFKDGFSCLLSKPQKPNVALFGDSHAHQYYDSLAKKMPDSSVLNISSPGCLPFSYFEQCKTNKFNNDWLIKFIKDNESIDTIFLTGYFSFLSADFKYGNIEGLRVANELTDEKKEAFKSSANKLLSALTSLNKRVIVFIDIPDLVFSPRQCVSFQNPIMQFLRGGFIRRSLDQCGVLADEFQARVKKHDEVLSGILSKYPKIEVFNPRPLLCDSRICTAFKDNHFLYWNSDHLTLEGTDMVINHFLQSTHTNFLRASGKVDEIDQASTMKFSPQIYGHV